tara:strand:+ start:391 stop:549 length:159 start_codon:yes stop_codon:yes gene_type:complete
MSAAQQKKEAAAVGMGRGVPLAPGELLLALRKALLEGLRTALLLPERHHLLS